MEKKSKVSVHSASTKGGAKAVHANADDKHVVVLKDIKVFLVPDGDTGWYAQALDLDYGAGGNSIDEAKENFQEGLAGTIREHLKYFGNIRKFLKPAPPEDWREYLETAPDCLNVYSTVDVFDLLRKGTGKTIEKEEFPFGKIKFLKRLESRSTSS